MNNMKKIVLSFFAVVVLILSMTPAYALAADDPCVNPTTAKAAVQCGVNGGGNGAEPAAAPKTLNETIATVINLLSLIVGVIAVIVVISAGFRYVTSGGKQESVTSAKNSLVYAIVGLIIVALAQLIVHFVLYRVSHPTPTGANPGPREHGGV